MPPEKDRTTVVKKCAKAMEILPVAAKCGKTNNVLVTAYSEYRVHIS